MRQRARRFHSRAHLATIAPAIHRGSYMFAMPAKIGALLFYAAALLSLFIDLPPPIEQVLQIGAVLLLVTHAIEVLLAFRWIRQYEGPLALSILLTLLFGFVHWLPIKKRAQGGP